MKPDTRCGLCCAECAYLESHLCGGCVATQGQPFHGACPVAACCQERELVHCGQCEQMPCQLLQSYTADPVHGDTPAGARLERCRAWASEGVLTRYDQGRVRAFLYRYARPLDMARYRYFFEGSDAGAVLEALAAYQNTDGGFAHGLEADLWSPHSNPATASEAVAILESLGVWRAEDDLTRGLLRYLGNTVSETGEWPFCVPENNAHPHAPWWHWQEGMTSPINPTAVLAGWALNAADPNSALYERALRTAQRLAERLLTAPSADMHNLFCLESLLDALERAPAGALFDLPALRAHLTAAQVDAVLRDQDNWDGYCMMPTDVAASPEHPTYSALRELVDRDLERMLDTLQPDGCWEISWRWNAYPEDFARAQVHGRVHVTLDHLLKLRAFGRMQEVTA